MDSKRSLLPVLVIRSSTASFRGGSQTQRVPIPTRFIMEPTTKLPKHFVTTYAPGEIFQFEGFPPGVDVQAVISAIQDFVKVIGGAFLASGIRQRRERQLLANQYVYGDDDDDDGGSTRRNLRSRNLHPVSSSDTSTGISKPKKLKGETTATKNQSPSKKGKNTSKSKKASSSSSSNDDEEEEEISIDVVTVTNNIQMAIGNLNDGTTSDTTELTTAIGKPLETTISNPSYTKEVLNGVKSTKYLANVQAIEVAMKIAVLADDSGNNSTNTVAATTSGAFASLNDNEKVAVRNAVEESAKLLKLLEGAIEGYN